MTQPEKSPKSLNDHLKALGGAALIVVFTLLLLEIALRVLDPWDMRYFNDLATMGNAIFTGDPARGYIMPDGTYQFSHWSATIENQQRRSPDTNPAASCTLMILGDSVAFGYGVNDADVWVNQLARQFPDVHFVNASVPRYNSTNVLRTFQTYPDANAYLYLIINNDITPAIDPETMTFAGSGEGLPFLVRYANFAIYRGGGTDYVAPTDPDSRLPDTPDTRRFFEEVDRLVADERVYLAAFELEPSTNTLLERGYEVMVLTYPPQRISITDYHVNPQGNLELAQQLAPLVEQMVAKRC